MNEKTQYLSQEDLHTWNKVDSSDLIQHGLSSLRCVSIAIEFVTAMSVNVLDEFTQQEYDRTSGHSVRQVLFACEHSVQQGICVPMIPEERQVS